MTKMMAFTKCNGEVVELSRLGYMPEHLAFTDGFTSYEGQSRFVKVVSGRRNGYTHYDVLGGLCSCGKGHLAERQIVRKANPSNHVCDGRCMAAKGPNCECSCHGKNHGVAA